MNLYYISLFIKAVATISLTGFLTVLILKNSGYFKGLFNAAKSTLSSMNEKQRERYDSYTRYIYKKKKGLLYDINMKIAQAGLLSWIINAKTVMALSALLLVLTFFGIAFLTGNKIFALYISIPACALPMLVINLICQSNVILIEKYMLYFMETLLNFLSINKNDILAAFDMAKDYCKPKVFQEHVKQFVFETRMMQKDFKAAVEMHKKAVNIRTYGEFLDAVSDVYTVGGNYETLLKYFVERLTKLQKAKIRRIKRAQSTRKYMIFLVAANILMYVYLYLTDVNMFYLDTSNFGVMTFNFVAMYFVLYLSYKAGDLKL